MRSGGGVQRGGVTAERARHRVIKTLAPEDRGAIELARLYGDALVCVRHRADAKGKIRHTTVELLVESRPMRPRPTRFVFLRLQAQERQLHAVVKAAGGKWDASRRLWCLPSRVASILNLRHKIVTGE